jgi:hypothetical protein
MELWPMAGSGVFLLSCCCWLFSCRAAVHARVSTTEVSHAREKNVSALCAGSIVRRLSRLEDGPRRGPARIAAADVRWR